ncbi:MAG: L,D-transpeptidase [Pseudolabrys sp.]|nr:L,D-transpeptidase [Pseudolabrys sp.]MDP2297820.1 L,D-transpeptidase [Pseudolabrys sp.]
MTRFIFVVCLFASFLIAPAQAGVVVTVDKTVQRLTVEVDGAVRHTFPVSTARWGYRTPNGSYRPQWLARKWFSRQYDWSPMPFSIFFNGGYAIHGSYEISRLGSPASHGCIRLHPDNAAVLFALVQAHVKDTQIVVTGEGAAGGRAGGGRTRAPASNRASDSFDNLPDGSRPKNPSEY